MQNGAYVDLYGRLYQDIQVRYSLTQKLYGIVIIAVKQKIGYHPYSRDPIHVTKLFQAVIWNDDLINKFKGLLTKGKRIYLKGELDIIQAKNLDPDAQLVITVRSEAGITILSNNTFAETEDEISPDCFDIIPKDIYH